MGVCRIQPRKLRFGGEKNRVAAVADFAGRVVNHLMGTVERRPNEANCNQVLVLAAAACARASIAVRAAAGRCDQSDAI